MKVLVAACLLGIGCSSSPSKAECDRIVEHLIDVFTAGKMAEGDGKGAPKEYVAAVNKWRQLLKDDKDPTHEALFQICTSQISSSATGCILQAGTEVELARCFAP